MADPNILHSGLSRKIVVGGLNFRVEIYRLEHEPGWSLEVIDKDGTSTVWDDQFKSDREALEELETAVREEGVAAFMDRGNVVPFPKR
jgi:hypothetical protein